MTAPDQLERLKELRTLVERLRDGCEGGYDSDKNRWVVDLPATEAIIAQAATALESLLSENEALREALVKIARKTSIVFGRGTMSGEEAADIARQALSPESPKP